MGVDVQQSIPICGALAGFGGILEVFSTAALAYPAARILEGIEWTDIQLKGCLALNIVLQILASLAGNLFATWFGPVALVGPIFFASQLLANMVVFWTVLGLEAFSREMQIGTYVIVVAVVLLIVNGPAPQDYGDTTFQELITELYAMIWASILLLSMLSTGVILACVDMQTRKTWFKLSVLLVARASAFALNLSTGKALVMPTNKAWLISNVVIKVISGIVYTHAIVVQSTTVEQKLFVPINAATIVFINAFTGIIIWEDWRVVQSWVGYACVFLLLALGCGLLLGDLGLLQETRPETFRGSMVSIVSRQNRQRIVDNLKNFGQSYPAEFGNAELGEAGNVDPERASSMGHRRIISAPSLGVVTSRSPSFGSQQSHGGPRRSCRSRVAWHSVYGAGRPSGVGSSLNDVTQQSRWDNLRRQLEAELIGSNEMQVLEGRTSSESSHFRPIDVEDESSEEGVVPVNSNGREGVFAEMFDGNGVDREPMELEPTSSTGGEGSESQMSS